MTKEERAELFRSERDRCIAELPNLDPCKSPELYGKLLDFIQNLEWRAREAEFDANETNIGEPIPMKDVELVDKVVEFPAPEESPYPEPEDSDPAKTYTMAEVRAALASSRKKGVNVTELIQEIGFDNFSAVPAAKYPEIMQKLDSL